jgi:predicted negative regulator of RcsB-dependent stress response
MKFDLEEQERIDKLKYFFRDWGKYILSLLVIIIFAYIADSLWNWQHNRNAIKTALLYQNFNQAVEKNNLNQVYSIVSTMEKNYPSDEYTALASMMAAKLAKNKLENKHAEEYLNFAILHTKDKALVDVARLRLADVYIDEKKFNLVMPLLMEKHAKSFDALYYSKRGDLHVARGELDKARESYKIALKMGGDNQSITDVVQMRLDVLGNN